MKYIKLTFQYIKRRFGYVFLYSILPAIIFTLTTDSMNIFSTIVNLPAKENANFLDVWLHATELNWGAFFIILSGLLLIIFASAFLGVMERDMRLGDLTHRKFFTRVNNNFLIVLKVFLVFVLVLELFGVVNSALIYLWYKVFTNVALYYTFSFCSLFVTMILFVTFSSLGFLWIPAMIMTGLNMRKSLVESLMLVKGKVFKLVLAIVLPVIPFFGLAMVASYFKIEVLSFFAELLLNFFLISYFLVLMFVTYFDATGTDREDLRKKIWEV